MKTNSIKINILFNTIYQVLTIMNWTNKNGAYPRILDMEDFDDIRNDKWHFCRKVKQELS